MKDPGARESKTLHTIGLPKTPTIDPARCRDETFELYSVPSFAEGGPEILSSSDIKSSKQVVQPGDVLLCKINPHLVRVWCVPPARGHRQIASGEWIVVRPRADDVDKEYLRYALIEPGFRARFMNTVSGVGGSLMRAHPKAVSQIPIAVPPLDEQRHTVAKLDSLFGRLKSAREELARIPRLAGRYKQAILAAAFRGDLTADWRRTITSKKGRKLKDEVGALRTEHFKRVGIKEKPAVTPSWTPSIELPAGWKWVSVDQLATAVQYGSSAKTSESPGVPVLRMGNIIDGKLDQRSLKYLPHTHPEFPELLLTDGDILFNRTNSAELVGKTTVYKDGGGPTSFASYLIRVRVVGYLPDLLSAYINSEYGRAWVASVVSQQVGQANVNGTKLRELGVPLMPMNEQQEIASRIKTGFTHIDQAAAEASRATDLLDRLDQATLMKAFRGELLRVDEKSP